MGPEMSLLTSSQVLPVQPVWGHILRTTVIIVQHQYLLYVCGRALTNDGTVSPGVFKDTGTVAKEAEGCVIQIITYLAAPYHSGLSSNETASKAFSLTI